MPRATVDLANRESIAACAGFARENAQQVREEISSEMWEEINDGQIDEIMGEFPAYLQGIVRQPRAQVQLDAPPVLPASLSMDAWAQVDRWGENAARRQRRPPRPGTTTAAVAGGRDAATVR